MTTLSIVQNRIVDFAVFEPTRRPIRVVSGVPLVPA